MNNIIVRSLFQLSIFLQLLTSCTQEISLDAGERAVVVECILSCDSVQTMKLFYSHAKDGNDTSMPITEADVTLFDETKNETAGTFHYAGGKDWTLDYAAEPEHAYRLDIDVKGHEHISAQQTMPKQVKVWSYIHKGGMTSSDHFFTKYGESFCGTGYWGEHVPAKTWIYAVCYDEKTGETHIADEICSDYPNVDNFNLTGDVYVPYIVEFETLIGMYPLKICNYLQGYPLYRRYIHTNADYVNPDYFNQEGVFIVSGSFYEYDNPNKEQPLGSKGGVFFTTVSDDYDRYLLEAIHYQQQQESDDMTTIYKRDNIFSNINGGVGIFGAKTEYRSDWVMEAYGKGITF